MDQKRDSEAIAHFTEALRIKPGWEDAMNNLGIALLNIGKTAEAIDCLKEILRINPNNTQARENLAAALENHGKR